MQTVIYRRRVTYKSRHHIKRKKVHFDKTAVIIGLFFAAVCFFAVYVLLSGMILPGQRTYAQNVYLSSLGNDKDENAILAQLKPPDIQAGEQTSQPQTKVVKGEDIIFHGTRQKKQIALTFDADMTYGMREMLDSGQVKTFYDKDILAILSQTNTKATFFLSGLWIEKYPDLTKQMAQNPLNELANHSYSHPSFSGTCYGLRQAPESEYEPEIQKTQDLLKSVAGVDNVYFRFPGGCYSQQNIELLKKLGLVAVQWDSEGVDGFNNDAASIINNVMRNAQSGSIIVLHFNGYPNEPKTAIALPIIISQLKDKGYEFVKISELSLDDTLSESLQQIKDHLPFMNAFL